MEVFNKYLQALNPQQQQAVDAPPGPIVVFAGAGSGKTRIITTRIVKSLYEGVPPSKILAVTFTNKAAAEMKSRLTSMTPLANNVLVGTFHSVCARWLREFADELGFSSNFIIYDESDSKSALKKILKDSLSVKEIGVVSEDMRYFINNMKTRALLPRDLEKEIAIYQDLIPAGGLGIYKKYQEYLNTCDAMDFGDLLLNTLFLLRTNSRVKQIMQSRFQYILVDEYQDTNPTQFELVNIIAESHQNLFVVGDDDQSIYSWRGATPENIIEFDKHYPAAKTIKLEQNYRSTSNIVSAASDMIINNENRTPKKIWTANEAGPLIQFQIESDNEMESWNIVETIKAENKVFSYDQVAIFYRVNYQSRAIEDALRSENIPYKIFGGTRFYDRAEIKDLLAYLRILINPKDDVSFKRIINTPSRKIGKKSLEILEQIALSEDISLYEAAQSFAQSTKKTSASTKIKLFMDLIEGFKHDSIKLKPDVLLERIISNVKYLDHIEHKHSLQYEERLANIHELISTLEDHSSKADAPSLVEWLNSVTLSSSEDETNAGVSLMTLHMAKGLEFNRVYVAGVEEGLIPHHNSLEDPNSIEEERRLFYVGMTRAMHKLSLLSAYRRKTYGGWNANSPSRFMKEVPAQFLECTPETLEYLSETKVDDTSDECEYEYDAAAITNTHSSHVKHPSYGHGEVVELYLEQRDPKALVDFKDFGKRKVSLRHLE